MEKGIEFSLTRPDAADVLGRVELFDATLDVDPPDGFKPFEGEIFVLPWKPKNVSPRVRWRLTDLAGAGVIVLEFSESACGQSLGRSRFNADLKVGSMSSR